MFVSDIIEWRVHGLETVLCGVKTFFKFHFFFFHNILLKWITLINSNVYDSFSVYLIDWLICNLLLII